MSYHFLFGCVLLILVLVLGEVLELNPITPLLRGWRRGVDSGIRIYRPSTWAVDALQRRLYKICDKPGYVEKALSGNDEHKEDVVTYTCYLFALHLGWGRIFNRVVADAGPWPFKAEKRSVVPSIYDTLQDGPFDHSLAFQVAIGELMVVEDSTGLRPMSYVAFRAKVAEDNEFKRLFAPLREGLQFIAKARIKGEDVPDHQLRRLQHGLLETLDRKDPDFRTIAEWSRNPCKPAEFCMCGSSACKAALLDEKSK